MRKISVLILAFLVLVILPTWAVAAESMTLNKLKDKREVGIILIIDEKTGELLRIYSLVEGTGKPYGDVTEQTFQQTLPTTMWWYGEDSSPWHWCFVNGRYIRCP